MEYSVHLADMFLTAFSHRIACQRDIITEMYNVRSPLSLLSAIHVHFCRNIVSQVLVCIDVQLLSALLKSLVVRLLKETCLSKVICAISPNFSAIITATVVYESILKCLNLFYCFDSWGSVFLADVCYFYRSDPASKGHRADISPMIKAYLLWINYRMSDH